MANSVDPDETPRSAASHLGLCCLLRPVCPNIYGKYGIAFDKFLCKGGLNTNKFKNEQYLSVIVEIIVAYTCLLNLLLKGNTSFFGGTMSGGPGVSLTLCCFVVYSTTRFVYVLPCVILFFCFSVLLTLRLPRLGKRELILVLFVRLFDLYLFGFVGFLFRLVSGKGCGL